MQRAWIAVIVVVGIILGVAIAGVPSRHKDAPLRISTSTTDLTGSGGTTTADPATGPASTASTVTTAAAAPATPAHKPSDVTVVVVATGTSSTGSKPGEITRQVHAAGYSTLVPVTDKTDHISPTVVEYAPGYGADATAVATILNLSPAAVQAVSDSPVAKSLGSGSNVMVVLSDS